MTDDVLGGVCFTNQDLVRLVCETGALPPLTWLLMHHDDKVRPDPEAGRGPLTDSLGQLSERDLSARQDELSCSSLRNLTQTKCFLVMNPDTQLVG
jgi:hypothetical protein